MILEIRTYRLKPGKREEFLRLARDQSLPLLAKHGIDVVDYGPSLVDEDGAEEAYLVRAFATLERRREQEAAFYGGDDWRHGPREAIVACIDSYHTIVIEMPEATIRAWQPARLSAD